MIMEYKNARGQSVLFAAPDGMSLTPFYLTGVQGAHGVEADIQGVAQFPRDGETYVGSRVTARTITLEGIIYSNRKALDRIRLLETMIPKEVGVLTATRGEFTRRINCIVERAPYFSTPRGDKYTIGLFCPDPYWEDAAGETVFQLNSWEGMFEFDLEIPDETDPALGDYEDGLPWIEFGRRANSSLGNVYNPGQIATGFVAKISAIGPVVHPELLNVRTQARMKFLLTMQDGDEIQASTSEFDKWALWIHADGTSENAMKYIDPSFVFFALETGDNACRAGADDGGDFLNVEFVFRPRYLGL